MTKQKYLKLPKVYELDKVNPRGDYVKHIGKAKLSYSSLNSFKKNGYRGEFFSTYFLNIRSEGNVFTKFGSSVGQFLETGVDEEGLLSEFDKKVLLEKIGRPEGAEYEREIVLERPGYVIHGYIDREITVKPKVLRLDDFKTGSIEKKKDFYASQDYQQTNLYAHQRTLEGNTIEYCGVELIDRKGNGNSSHPLRLTGEVELIPTPYSPERAEKFLLECDEVALEIQNYFAVYNKYLK